LRPKAPKNNICCCRDKEEEKTVEHLCSCPSLSSLRLKHLGFINNVAGLEKIKLKNLNIFLKASGWENC